MLWAHSQGQTTKIRGYKIIIFVTIAFASTAIGIGLRLARIAIEFIALREELDYVPVDKLHFARWGFSTLILGCGIITMALLLVSRTQKKMGTPSLTPSARSRSGE